MTQAGTSFYSRQTYFPYGAQRTTEGSALPTDYTFTGQKSDDSTGLMFYGARYYDAALGRFTQPDTIVPSPLNPQSLNRYAYGYNNPVRYLDPTGHIPCEDPDDCNPGQGGDDQPGDDPNVQPPTAPPYCEQYPEQCMKPPADNGDQGGDDGDCNVAKCGETQQIELPKQNMALCPDPKFCQLPSKLFSINGGGGVLSFFMFGGVDVVLDRRHSEIGFFMWSTIPNEGLVWPQYGVAVQAGKIWGMDNGVIDYKGQFDAYGGTVGFVTAEGFTSPNNKVQGYSAGISLGSPFELHKYSADYRPIPNTPFGKVNPIVLDIIDGLLSSGPFGP